ncbi:MAG: hypothetical protein ACRCT8_18355 [Lacipirellulaceae bacterium]
MEAAETKRAALRLIGALGGILVTVTLVIVAIVVSRRPSLPGDVVALVEGDDDASYGDSYALPHDDFPSRPSVRNVVQLIPSGADRASMAYVEPADRPLAASGGVDASGVWSGPVIIENPAARVAMIPRNASASRPSSGFSGPALREPIAGPSIAPPSNTSNAPEPTVAYPMPSQSSDPYAGSSSQAIGVAPLSDDDFFSYTASVNELSKRLIPEVRAGFQLGKGGAVYAARERFLGVLRKIATAKDAEEGGARHALALADGLRALEEADDFVPRGDVLEAELDTASLAQSHATPLLHDLDHSLAAPSPHEAVALYSRHAAQKLAEATAGEQAGSMALHGLGKTYARLSVQGGDATAGRKSAVTFRAAVLAHAGNYLAANELGVYLAQSGRYDQAADVLRSAAAQPGAAAMVYTNLAEVEQKRGQQAVALAAGAAGQRVAQAEYSTGAVSRRMGVEWMDPNAFRTTSVAAGPSQRLPYASASAAQGTYPQQPSPTMIVRQSGEAGEQNATLATSPTESANPFRRAMASVRRATGWDRGAPGAGSQEAWRETPTGPVRTASGAYPRVVR